VSDLASYTPGPSVSLAPGICGLDTLLGVDTSRRKPRLTRSQEQQDQFRAGMVFKICARYRTLRMDWRRSLQQIHSVIFMTDGNQDGRDRIVALKAGYSARNALAAFPPQY
jgi:hypothetical protein